ncbi:tRNA lysidine(34) synthetase TilS [Shiella aurantiaca]|nr:tRNA lysidine(34) synthetase TilS [Shiella aurantiaca]
MLQFFKENHWNPQQRLLVAVSGGIDSMVLLDLLGQLGAPLEVAHVNYGLRGEASEADEQLVRDYCAEKKLTLHLKKVQAADWKSESIQLEARTIRYQWFSELMGGKAGYICTAHHASDSLETILYNLSKGSGVRGLRGIPVENGSIIRPLLFATREEILAYAQERKLVWREDASNQKAIYSRNKIRLQVVPVLKEINPSVEQTVQAHSRFVRAAAHYWEQAVQAFVDQQVPVEGGGWKLSVQGIEQTPYAEELLGEMLAAYGFVFEQVQAAVEALKKGGTGKVFYSESHTLLVERECLWLFLKEDNPAFETLTIPALGQWGDFELKSVPASSIVSLVSPPHVAYFDAQQVQWPLKVRAWQTGDWFIPLGMKGKKKLSDFMIDAKIPLNLKASLPVLESAGAIMWLVGQRIDERFKVKPDSTELIRIEWIKQRTDD